jgi:hypothetical protein
MNVLQYRKSFWITGIIITCIFFLVRCANSSDETVEKQVSIEDYTIAEQCAGCHKEVHNSFVQTAHYKTGQPVDKSLIKGSFKEGENTYSYTTDILLSMQKRDSGLYQVAYFKGEEKKAMRFDITVGSGVMGQSFLTWRGNKLFQLPITYFTAANQWSNSPGFPAKKVMIDRPVTARCLECHVTYAKATDGSDMEPTGFDRNKMIFGVDCQKCHGPAAKHVQYHQTNTADKQAKYIINPAQLNRQQQLDLCTLCHGGNIQKTKPSFTFTAGKKLSDYFTLDSGQNIVFNSSAVDVHGNQVGLLKASKCFQLSTTMTCSTCHNTHVNEREQMQTFSQKCIACHNTNEEKFKALAHQQVATLEMNCIDCHMPSQTSKSIAVFLQGEETPRASKLRSHLIGIYTDETTKFLKQNKK